MDTKYPPNSIDAVMYPLLQGKSVSVPKAHLQWMIELLEAGKPEQVKVLLQNLIDRKDIWQT